MKTIKFEVDERFHETIKLCAAREGKTMQAYIVGILNHALAFADFSLSFQDRRN